MVQRFRVTIICAPYMFKIVLWTISLVARRALRDLRAFRAFLVINEPSWRPDRWQSSILSNISLDLDGLPTI